MRIRDDEPCGAALRGESELTAAMHVPWTERVLVPHHREAPADLRGTALEILGRAAPDIAQFCPHTLGRRRLRSKQRIARELCAVLQQQRRVMKSPARVRDRLGTNLCSDGREPLMHEIERLRF